MGEVLLVFLDRHHHREDAEWWRITGSRAKELLIDPNTAAFP